MSYLVRNFLPSSPNETFEESPHDTEEAALLEYQTRCEAVVEVGGAVEILLDGKRIGVTCRPLGGKS